MVSLSVDSTHTILFLIFVSQLTYINCQSCGSPAWFTIPGIDNQCFHVSIIDLNWAQARDHCNQKGKGADLAQPKGKGDLGTMATYFKKYHRNQFYYIGGSDHAHEGAWRWLNGDKISGGWRGGEPNEDGGGEDCLVINPWNGDNNLWDFVCSVARPFICQRPQ